MIGLRHIRTDTHRHLTLMDSCSLAKGDVRQSTPTPLCYNLSSLIDSQRQDLLIHYGFSQPLVAKTGNIRPSGQTSGVGPQPYMTNRP